MNGPPRPELVRYELTGLFTLVPGRWAEPMDLEETLDKIVELSREELHIVRKRAEEKTAARDHGHDFDEMKNAAGRLDHYAHQLRRLHDNELGEHWRHESLQDTPPRS